jgi:hypothetical protein
MHVTCDHWQENNNCRFGALQQRLGLSMNFPLMAMKNFRSKALRMEDITLPIRVYAY